MKAFLPLILLVALPAWAKDKAHYDYQSATLVSFRTTTTGSSCSSSTNTAGNIDANTDSAGLTTGTVSARSSGSSNCSADTARLYTVRTDTNTYILERAGWSLKPSVLSNILPGTRVLVRSDGKHVFVKIDKHESEFAMIEAQ